MSQVQQEQWYNYSLIKSANAHSMSAFQFLLDSRLQGYFEVKKKKNHAAVFLCNLEDIFYHIFLSLISKS